MKWSLFLVFTLFLVSCSMFKNKQQIVIERTIASIEPNQVKVDEVNGTLFVTTIFEVMGKHKGDNSFEIQLPYRLQNDLDRDLPYDVMINSSDVDCMDNGTLDVLEKNYHYRRLGWSYSDKLKCAYNGMEDKKAVSITFAFQKLKKISIEDANLFVHPVNDASKDAVRILKEVKKGNNVHYLSSRLLYDVLADKNDVVLEVNHANPVWLKSLSKNDILRIENPKGKIEVPTIGTINHLGYESQQFNKKAQAGKKFSEKEEIRHYELYCRIKEFDGREYVRHFRWDNKLDIYDAKEVKCGINQKKVSARKLKKLKGQFEFSISYINYVTLQKRIETFLKEPQKDLDKYIDRLNQSNIEIVKSHANKIIEIQIKAIAKENLLAQQFPFTIEKEFVIDKVEITNRAQIATMKSEGSLYQYIDLGVYARPTLGTVSINENDIKQVYRPGELYLGKILTNKLLSEKVDLYDYYIYQTVCGQEFVESYIPQLKAMTEKNEKNELSPISFEDYKEKTRGNYLVNCEGQSSRPTIIVLHRVKIQKCGEVSPYKKQVARHEVEKGQVNFTHVVASYDLLEGIQKDYQLDHYELYKIQEPMAEAQLVQTDNSLQETQNCIDISEDDALKLIGH